MPAGQTALQTGLKRLVNNEGIKAPGELKELKPKVPRCQQQLGGLAYPVLGKHCAHAAKVQAQRDAQMKA